MDANCDFVTGGFTLEGARWFFQSMTIQQFGRKRSGGRGLIEPIHSVTVLSGGRPNALPRFMASDGEFACWRWDSLPCSTACSGAQVLPHSVREIQHRAPHPVSPSRSEGVPAHRRCCRGGSSHAGSQAPTPVAPCPRFTNPATPKSTSVTARLPSNRIATPAASATTGWRALSAMRTP